MMATWRVGRLTHQGWQCKRTALGKYTLIDAGTERRAFAQAGQRQTSIISL